MFKYLIAYSHDYTSYYWGLVAIFCVLPAIGIAYVQRLSIAKRLWITAGCLALAAFASFFSQRRFVDQQNEAALIFATWRVTKYRYEVCILEQTNFLPLDLLRGGDGKQLVAVNTPEQIRERDLWLPEARSCLEDSIKNAQQARLDLGLTN